MTHLLPLSAFCPYLPKQLILISIATHLTVPEIGPFGVDLLTRIELLMCFLGLTVSANYLMLAGAEPFQRHNFKYRIIYKL